MYKFLLLILLTCTINLIESQDFSNLNKDDLIKISGSIGVLGTSYNVNGIEPRRDPYFWQINANLNINTMSVSIPLTLRLTQQERSFTQPFNQYGLSPKYKAFTMHIGYRSMTFSELSLGGNQFMGIGLEVNPENSLVSGKILVGRFARAVDGYYQDGTIIGVPSYERWGYGSQITLGTKDNKISVQAFKAKDIISSIINFSDDATIKPADNLVFGISTKQKISKYLTADAEIDWSAYTSDTRVPESVLEGYSYINNLGMLLYANSTTTFNKAILAKLKYKKDKLGLNLKYRRIDPEYKTMGAVYLNNDFEDITIGGAYQFFKNKLNASVSGGLQRNNLNSDKSSEMIRLISSMTVNYAPNQEWSFSSNFSNFNSQSSMTLINVLDTIRYAQITKNMGINIIRTIKIKENSLSTMMGLNFQNAKINSEINTVFYNANIGTQYGLIKSRTNLSLNINISNNTSQGIETTSIGPSFNFSKAFRSKKITLAYSNSLLKSYTDRFSDGYIINNKITVNYKIDRHHVLTSNISIINRNSSAKTYLETVATISYNFTF